MALSLKNVPEQVDSNTEINLIDDLIKRGGGEAEPLNLDDWPILLLLKGLSVSTVKFTTDNTEIIQNWADRMAEYQALFLEDPAYLVPSEREWNEKDPTTGEFAVECIFHKKKELKQKQKIVKPLFFVPPMEAPVALDPQSADKFLQEVENQHPQEILQRVQGILKEYVSSSPSIDNQLMSYLIGDIIVIALENDLLLKAEQLAEEYEESLVHIWQDNDRFKQLLASYNPKAHEVSLWASIFKSYKLKGLVESLSFLITSEASAQIVQLLSFRAQISSNEMIELCFESPPSLQMILLQWLAPHWKEKHYTRLQKSLKESIQKKESDLTGMWLNALITSSPEKAFQELLQYFLPKKISFFKKEKLDPQLQTAVLRVVSQTRSPYTLEFLKKLKPLVSGPLADQTENLIGTFKRK